MVTSAVAAYWTLEGIRFQRLKVPKHGNHRDSRNVLERFEIPALRRKGPFLLIDCARGLLCERDFNLGRPAILPNAWTGRHGTMTSRDKIMCRRAVGMPRVRIRCRRRADQDTSRKMSTLSTLLPCSAAMHCLCWTARGRAQPRPTRFDGVYRFGRLDHSSRPYSSEYTSEAKDWFLLEYIEFRLPLRLNLEAGSCVMTRKIRRQPRRKPCGYFQCMHAAEQPVADSRIGLLMPCFYMANELGI